jgi:type III secretion protein Q
MAEVARRKAGGGTGRSARTRAAMAAADGLRGRIPSLLPGQADALRQLFAAPEHWVLRDAGVLRFAPGNADAAGEWLELEADGVRLGLRLESTTATRADDALHWSDYSGRARLLAWALAHEAQLVRLSDALGASLLPVDPGQPRDPEALERDPDLWLGFSIEDAGHDTTHGTLRLPCSWVERLLARAEPTYADDPLPELDRWRQLPVPVDIRLPGPRLRGSDWRALRPGDVIVLGSRARKPQPQACAADRRWPLASGLEGWRVEGPPQSVSVMQESSAMNDEVNTEAADAGAGADADAAHGARDLPVALEFDLGRVQMSMGELAALQPGYVFALPTHLQGANVIIRANGHVAGRGEVVAVGDTLGVRLLSWS